MVAATLREHQIVILRTEIDEIVAHTMQEAHTKNPNMISIEEYIALSSNHPHMLAQLTINISKYVLFCLRFNGCFHFSAFLFSFLRSIISEYTRNNVIALSTPRGFASAMNLHTKLTA